VKRLTVFAIISFACSARAAAADFGLAEWGATREDILAAAGRPLEELELGDNYFMVYVDEFAGHPAQLWYWLEPDYDALTAGVISAAYPTLETFYDWEEALSAQFGPADVADEFATRDEAARARAASGDRAAQEQDIRNGLYRFRRAWETDTTLASLVAGGAAGELSVDAVLSSAELGGALFEIGDAAPREEETP
jgi:hypothetical protein